jgi:hypothetical protein
LRKTEFAALAPRGDDARCTGKSAYVTISVSSPLSSHHLCFSFEILLLSQTGFVVTGEIGPEVFLLAHVADGFGKTERFGG